MSYEQAFDILKNFFENKPAATQAITKLKRGEEIQLLIDGQFQCALFNDKGQSTLEKRPATRPNVEFRLNPEAVRRLTSAPEDNMAQFGIEVVKEVIAGNVQIKVPGSVWGVLTGGYAKIIVEAGPEFAQFLAKHGFDSFGKIKNLIKSMKKN